MTVLLREHSIPARFVEGFLPGTLDKRTGVEQVFNPHAHAWVEVYFPGYGWYMFDPTGNGSGRDRSAAQRQAGGRAPRRAGSRASLRSRPTTRGRQRSLVARAGRGRRVRRRRRRRAGRLHPDRGGALRGDRARRLPRLAARSARPGDARERVDRDRPARRRASASGRDRRRPPTSTRRPSARSCPASGPSCRRSRPRRSRSPTAAGSSATTGSRRSATSYAKLRVGLLRLLFRRGDRKRLKR